MPDWPRNPWAMPAIGAYEAVSTRAADGIRAAGAFGDPEGWRFGWERSYTRQEWLDHVPTGGDASQFPPAKLAEVLDGVGSAIDAFGGSITMRYAAVVVTVAYRARTAASGG